MRMPRESENFPIISSAAAAAAVVDAAFLLLRRAHPQRNKNARELTRQAS